MNLRLSTDKVIGKEKERTLLNKSNPKKYTTRKNDSITLKFSHFPGLF